jgi:beta-N-acetylhexosaminidase
MRRAILLALAVVLAAGAGLAAGDPAKVDIRGKVTKVMPADAEGKKRGLVGVVMVEGTKDKDTGYDKASVKVTEKTSLKKRVGKDLKDAKFEDVKEGTKVEAVFTGPVLQSFPVQATAKEVVILEEAK